MTIGDAFGPGERRPQLRGVSGWLLFLCIILLVILPLRLAALLWALLTMPGLVDPVAFAIVVGLPLLGIVGGVLLYREHLLGLRLVQVFFGLQVAFGVVGLIAGGGAGRGILSVPAAGAWLAYLFLSERVRNTYFENDNPKRAAEVFR